MASHEKDCLTSVGAPCDCGFQRREALEESETELTTLRAELARKDAALRKIMRAAGSHTIPDRKKIGDAWAYTYGGIFEIADEALSSPSQASVVVPRELVRRFHAALSEGRDYARNWTKHTGSINGQEFSDSTLDLDRELRALISGAPNV